MKNEIDRQIRIEIERQHASILLERVAEMKRSGWTEKEIAAAIVEWPEDWQYLVGKVKGKK